MNRFQKMLLNYFSKEELKKINKTHLLIIGCGGLGSNIANILLRCGFKKIILVDFDLVSFKNLNRQFFFQNQCGKKKTEALKENLLKINQKTDIKTINEKIDEEKLEKIIKKNKIDIIIEAVDDENTKKMIFEKTLTLNKRVVSASGVAGFGDTENIKIKRGKNFSLIGDMKKSVQNYKPLAPKVCAIASIQADEVLRMVLKNG